MGKKSLVIILVFLLAFPLVSADVVITNSRDWQELYLGAYYSAYTENRFIYFETLYDSNVKSQTIAEETPVLVLEKQSRPVVKNYANLLEVRGYASVEEILYEEYSDLQSALVERAEPEGVVLIYDRFGIEAVAAFPYMLENNLFPIFINEENEDAVLSSVGSFDTALVIGYFPVRMLENVDSESIRNLPEENAHAMTRKMFSEGLYDWGILVNAQEVDLTALSGGSPVFVFNENLEELSAVIAESNIGRFEAIGGEMANVAQSLRSRAEQELRFIVRYAQTYTNIEGLSGQVLLLDRVKLPAPTMNVSFVEARFYPQTNTLTYTLENGGTLDALFFTNFEFRQSSFSDNNTHLIRAGETRTIPYIVENMNGEELGLTANTIFGFSEPLTRSLSIDDVSGGNEVIIDESVDSSDVSLVGLEFDDAEGIFYATVESVDAVVAVEVFFDNSSLVSQEVKGSQEIVIPAPYVPRDTVVGKSYDVGVYFGSERITQQKLFRDVVIEERSGFPFVIVAIVVVLLLLIYFFKRRK